MSLSMPVSVSDQANIMVAHLTNWAEPRGGYAKVMANMRHLWEELIILTDKPRLLLVFAGEEARGNQAIDRDYRVDRTWNVAIVRGHGFRNLMSDPQGDVEPFYQNVEDVRDHVRVLLNISEEFPVEYRGMEPLPSLLDKKVNSAFGDGYLLKFSTANDIPAIALADPSGE